MRVAVLLAVVTLASLAHALPDSRSLEIVLLVLTMAGGVGFYAARVRTSGDPLDVLGLFALLYLFYTVPLGVRGVLGEVAHLAPGILHSHGGRGHPHVGLTSDPAATYSLVVLLGLVALVAGMSIRPARSRVSSHTSFSHDRLHRASIGLMVVGALLFMGLVVRLGGPGEFARIGYGGKMILRTRDLGFLYHGLDLFMYGLLIAVGLKIGRGERTGPALWVGILSFAFVVLNFLGDRFYVLTVAVGLVVAHHELRRRISLRAIIALGLIGYAGLVAFNVGRYVLNQEGLLASIAYAARETTVSSLNPIANAESWGPPLALWVLIDQEGRYRPWNGAGYVNAVLAVPPNTLHHGPKPPSGWYLERFWPSLAARGYGLGFSPLADGYLNFGAYGSILQMFVYGAALQGLSAMLRSWRGTVPATLIKTLAISWSFVLLRIDFMTSSKALLYEVLIPVAVLILFARTPSGYTTTRVPSSPSLRLRSNAAHR